jgi:hypothetical protein
MSIARAEYERQPDARQRLLDHERTVAVAEDFEQRYQAARNPQPDPRYPGARP